MTPDTTIVIFGGTGDLAQRKLIPALYNLCRSEQLPPRTRIVGLARRELSREAYQARLQAGVQQFSAHTYADEPWQHFAERLHYVSLNLATSAEYAALERILADLEGEPGNRLYYLAIAPTLVPDTIAQLGESGFAHEAGGYRRVIIEKPYGRDLESAMDLNTIVHRSFREDQIYRIDHYLGKETAQNILFFRFANSVFESVWNRSHIDQLQITVAESVDVEGRGAFYDQTGTVRDIIQNHMLQVLTLVAMEPPASFSARDLRNEKVKLLSAVRAIAIEDTVRGQYAGYQDAEGVAADSATETYAALRLYIDNWRWSGVPVYLRSGKALPHKATEVTIQFKQPPRGLLNADLIGACSANSLSVCIQPDEGIHFRFETKVPGSMRETRPVDMAFHYDAAFGPDALPEAYVRLLLDAMQGDASLFIRSDEIERAWEIVDPVLNAWASDAVPLHRYAPGSWGPEAADALLAHDGYRWQLGCTHDPAHATAQYEDAPASAG
jgi:glucose-6-phosphate 1-dehydrogenase